MVGNKSFYLVFVIPFSLYMMDLNPDRHGNGVIIKGEPAIGFINIIAVILCNLDGLFRYGFIAGKDLLLVFKRLRPLKIISV